MTPKLKRAFEAEMAAAHRLCREGRLDHAFLHLEIAHVLGQRYVLPHIRTHWRMLKLGWRRRSPAEIVGQAVRIVPGAIGSACGIVPTGNTGGTNINMFKQLPIAPDIARLLDNE